MNKIKEETGLWWKQGGVMEFTEKEIQYMDFLDGIPCDNHGLLLYKGDPNCFYQGMEDYFAELKEEDESEVE